MDRSDDYNCWHNCSKYYKSYKKELKELNKKMMNMFNKQFKFLNGFHINLIAFFCLT